MSASAAHLPLSWPTAFADVETRKPKVSATSPDAKRGARIAPSTSSLQAVAGANGPKLDYIPFARLVSGSLVRMSSAWFWPVSRTASALFSSESLRRVGRRVVSHIFQVICDRFGVRLDVVCSLLARARVTRGQRRQPSCDCENEKLLHRDLPLSNGPRDPSRDNCLRADVVQRHVQMPSSDVR